MHELLTAIQSELQARLIGFRQGDIYLTPDLGFLAQGVKMPCIGIKDGPTSREYLVGGGVELTMVVRLAIFFDLTGRQAALVGNEAIGKPGILQVKNEVIDILEHNLLGITGMEEAMVIEDPASQMYLTERKEMYQRKDLALRYMHVKE